MRRALGCGGLEDVPDAGQALAGVVGQQVAALGHEALDGVVLEGWIVGTGQGEQVGQREAAPGSAQNGERGDAIGWMQQGAGERGEVEHLLALAEGVDLDRAEGDCIFLFQRRNNLSEVVAAAHQDGDLPGIGASRRRGLASHS